MTAAQSAAANKKIIAYVRKHGSIKSADVMKILKCLVGAAKSRLKTLCTHGKLKNAGRKSIGNPGNFPTIYELGPNA